MHHARPVRLIILIVTTVLLLMLQRLPAVVSFSSATRRRLGLGVGFGYPSHAAARRSLLHQRQSSHSPRLDLVFDINKTILLEDPAGGKGERALLNEIASELAWGRVLDGEDGGGGGRPPRWVSAGLPLSVDPPLLPPSLPPLSSYSAFAHALHPDVAGGDLKAAKRARDGLKGRFTEEGGPGREYASEVEAMEAALRLHPPASTLDPQLLAEAGLGGGRGDRVVLLPAFMRFLLRLDRAAPPTDEIPSSFALQFRTFGDDLPRVAREFNALCRGRHPLFPGQGLGLHGDKGGNGGVDHALDLEGDAECFGCMYRDAGGPVLILGTFEPPASRHGVEAYRRRGHRVLESVQEMHAFVRGRQASGRPSLAIRDYWPWWRENLEEGSAGKLVLVDDDDYGHENEGSKSGPTRPRARTRTLTVTLDDNIERARSHIIDLRWGRTGAPVPFAEGVARGHLVRAEPYLALKHPESYFWDVLQESIRRWRNLEGAKEEGAQTQTPGGPGPAAGA